SGLSVVTGVTVGGTQPCPFAIVDDGRLEITLDANAASGAITLKGPFGNVAAVGAFTLDGSVAAPKSRLPILASFSPASGGAGARVYLSGANLGLAAQVRFNGAAASVAPSYASSSSLFVDVPVGAASGLITVETPFGVATSADPFLVLSSPAI